MVFKHKPDSANLKSDKVVSKEPKRNYHKIMALDQAEPAVIGYDDTDRRSLVAVKRVKRRGKGEVLQIPNLNNSNLVSIMDMYLENEEVVIFYEQMDVSLRHITGILQDPLKPFQIATICKEAPIPEGLMIQYLLTERKVGGWTDLSTQGLVSCSRRAWLRYCSSQSR